MNKQKIAIMVDSCCDVPKEYVDRYGMYVLPLRVIYKDREYLDGVTIIPEEIYQTMDRELPTTSLPSADSIIKLLEQIKEDGYKKVVGITISSELSGTYNQIRVVSEEVKGIELELIDTKNITMGAGFSAIQAYKYIQEEMDFQDIVQHLRNNIYNSKIFFVVNTLEYLKKGGRIGLVSAHLGSVLNLKPIISCNEEGVYYTVSKVRGRKKSLNEVIRLGFDLANRYQKIYLAICHGAAKEEANKMREYVLPKLDNIEEYLETTVSPVIGIHTGPGAIGIGVYVVEE